MKLTPAQKMYGAVLALGLGALFVDRVLIGSNGGEPQEAKAKPAAVVKDETPSTSDIAATALEDARPARPLIVERLASAASTQGTQLADGRDGFVPATSWAGESADVPPPAPPPRITIEQFQKKHRLMAVMSGDGRRFAVVDGRTLLIGQTLDGFTLVSVRERSAVLESEELRVELVLSQDH